MKKKVVLKRMFHRDKWRIAILFDYDARLKEIVRSISGSAFSGTNKCFYVDDSEENLKLVLITLKDAAEVDISHLVSDNELPETIEMKSEASCPEISLPDRSFRNEDESEDIHLQKTIVEVNGNKQQNNIRQGFHESGRFGPVEFSISEKEGLLIIRFPGRYDPEWISEMRSYGKCYFDKEEGVASSMVKANL
jgi:hypothetical protein